MAEIVSNFPASFDDLPTMKWDGDSHLYQWQGFWYRRGSLSGAVAVRSKFQARDDDVILAGSMKTGTTWLKALIPTIIAVAADKPGDPLVKHHPNALMPSLELQIFSDDYSTRHHNIPEQAEVFSRQLFRTHMPYTSLPESVKSSGCKIVYVTRDPKDVVVSLWHFVNSDRSARGLPVSALEEIFESFCQGVHPFGPFHDHAVGYWRESLKRPEKILFMRYAEMKRDPAGEVRKLAEFIGRPLEGEEEVEKVLRRCSLERLKNLEVNRNGMEPWGVPKSAYFRLGVVGDWKNSLTKEMADRLDEITRRKLESSGLDL